MSSRFISFCNKNKAVGPVPFIVLANQCVLQSFPKHFILQMLSMNFLAAKTDFWCAQPQENQKLWTVEQWRNFSGQSNDACAIYDVDYANAQVLKELEIR